MEEPKIFKVSLTVYALREPRERSNYYKIPLEELRVRLNDEFEAAPYGDRSKEMQVAYSRRLTIGR